MKILHTSDWHLGHSLYNYDRMKEQAEMLRQIVDIARSEKPDIFLLCGDIYHTAQPSAAVQRMFADTMTELHSSCPEMQIFVTAGNHDSASRHDIFNRPWRALNVTTIGSVPSDNIESLIFEVNEKCFVVAVPYCHERNMPDGLFQKLLKHAEELNRHQLPVIMTAHAAVAGSDFRGHEQVEDISVGGIDCVAINDFGSGYDYLALGHIHRPQTLRGGHGRIRYCGTPLPVSFDEDYPHSVSIVEITNRGDKPAVKEVLIANHRPLVTLPAEGFASYDEALEMLEDFPADIPAYIRLNVMISDFLPPLAREEAIAATRGKKCRFCHINMARTQRIDRTDRRDHMSVSEFRKLSPLEIADKYAEESGNVLGDDLKELLKEIYSTVNEEERE